MNARQGETDTEIMQRAIKIVQTTIEKRDKQIAALKPRAAYADEVLDSISCITTTQLAMELSMSTQELNRRLCEMRIQYWQSGQYMLYAGYARQGFAKSRTRMHTVKSASCSPKRTWYGRSADVNSSTACWTLNLRTDFLVHHRLHGFTQIFK